MRKTKKLLHHRKEIDEFYRKILEIWEGTKIKSVDSETDYSTAKWQLLSSRHARSCYNALKHFF